MVIKAILGTTKRVQKIYFLLDIRRRRIRDSKTYTLLNIYIYKSGCPYKTRATAAAKVFLKSKKYFGRPDNCV